MKNPRKKKNHQSGIGVNNRVRKSTSYKSLMSEFDKLLLKEMKESSLKADKKSISSIKKSISTWREKMGIGVREYNNILKDIEEPKEKKSRAKKVNLRNRVSTLLSRYLDEARIDLFVYDIVSLETKKIEINSLDKVGSRRFNLVLKNIYDSIKDKGLNLKMIESSFDLIFKDYSGLKEKEQRIFDEYVPFYNCSAVFGSEPVYIGVQFKITVKLMDVLTDRMYTADEDDAINQLMSRDQLDDWFRYSKAKRVARDYDNFFKKKGHSESPEFVLIDRTGDKLVHYELTVSNTFHDRYETELEADNILPIDYEKSQQEQKISNLTQAKQDLLNSLPYLDGEDKRKILAQIQEISSKLDFEKRVLNAIKPGVLPAAAIDEKVELERIASNERIEMKKIEASQQRVALIERLLDKGMTIEEIKKLIG